MTTYFSQVIQLSLRNSSCVAKNLGSLRVVQFRQVAITDNSHVPFQFASYPLSFRKHCLTFTLYV